MSDVPCLIDLRLDVPLLQVALSAAPPVMDLRLALEKLPATLAPQTPVLALVPRLPQELDAALIPILVGLPAAGGPGPVSATFSWSAGGLLTQVSYADGKSKLMTWSGSQLTRVDSLTPGLPTRRADFVYNPDGSLSAVNRSEV